MVTSFIRVSVVIGTRNLSKHPVGNHLNTHRSSGFKMSVRPASATSASASERLVFNGRTALVTGGARGIGREYVELLASRGANVVINDFGGSRSGASDPSELSVAEKLAEELRTKYSIDKSKVVSNSESISDSEGVKRLIEFAYKQFGRIDILINNAGILRDRSFAKMTIDDWDQVYQVHLRGAFLVSHACWPIMKSQSYGRIVMTSSTSGLYGNFGQANYSAAKMGLIGLSNTLAIEGAKDNIHCNVIVPMAASRMTQDIINRELADKLKPSYIAPMTVWLCHESCHQTGGIFEAAGQWFGCHKLHRSKGKYLPGICDNHNQNSLELIKANIDDITSMESKSEVDSFGSHLGELLSVLGDK